VRLYRFDPFSSLSLFLVSLISPAPLSLSLHLNLPSLYPFESIIECHTYTLLGKLAGLLVLFESAPK